MFVESKVLEFKTTYSSSIAIVVAAFLNTEGGTIIIGVEDDGEFVGVVNAKRMVVEINSLIQRSILPDPKILVTTKIVQIGNIDIISVNVKKSDLLHAVVVNGVSKYFFRQSDKNIGQNKYDAERRRLNEKYGIKLIKSAPLDDGSGLFNKIGDYPSGAHYYKYMSLETALLCLENKTIRFAEPTDWADKYEGRFYKAEIKGVKSSENNPPLVGCCFTYRQDNEAAWKLYSYEKQGLSSKCVEFKIDKNKLREQLFKSLKILSCPPNKFSLYEGCIDYWNQQKIDNLGKQKVKVNRQMVPNEFYDAFFYDFNLEKYLNLMLLKRNAFLHEQEIRFLLVPEEHDKYTKTKFKPIDLNIDWSDILLEVRVDAHCSDYEQQLLKNALKSIKSHAPLIPFNVYKQKYYARPIK